MGRFPYSPAKSRSKDFEVAREAIDRGLGFKMCIIRVLRKKIKRRTICFYLDVDVGDVTSVGVVDRWGRHKYRSGSRTCWGWR